MPKYVPTKPPASLVLSIAASISLANSIQGDFSEVLYFKYIVFSILFNLFLNCFEIILFVKKMYICC